MKIVTDFNALSILVDTIPMFTNTGVNSVWVLVANDEFGPLRAVNYIFELPFSIHKQEYDVEIYDAEPSHGLAIEVPAGKTIYIKVASTNKVMAYVGSSDAVWLREIANNISISGTNCLLTGGLTMVAGGLGLISVGSEFIPASVTVKKIDKKALAQIAYLCYPNTVTVG